MIGTVGRREWAKLIMIARLFYHLVSSSLPLIGRDLLAACRLREQRRAEAENVIDVLSDRG